MKQIQARGISRRAILRGALYGAGAATMASVLAACSTPAVPSAPGAAATAAPAANTNAGALKIGLLSGFSGPYAAFGPDMPRSMDVYLDQHNGMLGGLKPTVFF